MLPRKRRSLEGAVLGLLVLCVISDIVAAGSLRSNILSSILQNKYVDQEEDGNATTITDSCYTCKNNSDCEDVDLIECNTEVNEDTRCYIQYEMPLNIVSMGCISDFESEKEIIDLIKNKSLYICTGNKCNGLISVPQPNRCVSCRSDTEESCAISPEKFFKDEILCNLPPYTQCYERVDDATNGITERGCLYSLSGEDFYDCLMSKENGKCRICTGNRCNSEIVPKDRPKCHRCDSSEDKSCEETPKKASICSVYNADETCVATYENGVTRRGCSSELDCDAQSKFCQKCTESGCNIANLQRRADELYGIFIDLPLNCYDCNGRDCKRGNGVPRKCEGDAYQDCMTVFDEQGQVLQRGCEKNVLQKHETHCAQHPELCFNCKSNGCNTMTDASKYQKCLYCDSASNPDCLFKPESVSRTRACVEGCVSSVYARKTQPNVFDFVRTCFEDIEMDNREECTEQNNCVRCETGDNCNTAIVPEIRLSCLHCSGSDCNNPVAKKCTAFSLEDQCYMFFDNVTFSTERMGCASDLRSGEIEALPKQYFLCDGDNCNDYKNLPEAKICVVCNSANDINCAIAPDKITTVARCQTNPYTDCYNRINKDGHTERGCYHDLEVETFVKCKNGEPDETCKICTESQCNNKIYPTRRQQCHRCNSADDPKCESSPSNGQPCPIYDEADTCVTKLIEGITHRGCKSEISCADSNYKNCNVCKNRNCNTVDLKANAIGDPGLFQDLPLNCYHCMDETECKSALGPIRVCRGDLLQTCTVAFNGMGTVVARGCSDTVNEICSGTGNQCYDCKSSGCNEALMESDFVDCVFCDAKDGEDCVFNVDAIKRRRKCSGGCMTALYPRTKDKEPVFELLRTCLDDLDLDDRELCKSGQNSDWCLACSGTTCNKQELGERKACYHCKGADCQVPVKKTCRATMAHDQCFIEYDENGAIVEMGCKSKYDPEDVMTLLYAKRIWFCDGENCNDIENVPEQQKCFICNSRTDEKCATTPSELKINTDCNRSPYTECYTRVLEDGQTERGCLSNLADKTFADCLIGGNSNLCTTCKGDNCNNELYPINRRSCHICDSNLEKNCEKSPVSTQVCPIYTENEQCVSLVDRSGKTKRGCSSQLSCDGKKSSKCQICPADSCNRSNVKRKIDANPGVWQSLPLTCNSCNTVDECASSPKEEVCTDNQYCMTVFSDSGEVTARGCSETVESQFGLYCDDNPANCFNCNSNKCNSAKFLTDYTECIFCDSEMEPECVLNPDDVPFTRMCNGPCMTALYAVENSDAFALTRTCLDDKDEADRNKCDDDHCTACKSGSECNKEDLPKDRWSCHVCTDEDCNDSVERKCVNYKQNEQCYMLFNSDNTVLGLGCASELDEKFINSNYDSLYFCNKGSNCNSFANIPQPKRCVQCDSSKDPDCASNPENIPTISTCTSLANTQCFTQISDGITKRGCISTLAQSERRSCLEGSSNDCTFCNTDNCNKDIFPADRRRCHRCNSIEDPNCSNSPDSETVCPFYTEDEFCTTHLIDGQTHRGCSSDFQCDATDYVNCRLCRDADSCNTVDLLSKQLANPGKWQGLPLNCYTCQGESCQNVPDTTRKCDTNALQNCVTIFNEDGVVTERGCSDRVLANEATLNYCDKDESKCKICQSNGCNIGKSLGDYVDCVYCDGAVISDCVHNIAAITKRRSCHKKCMTALYPRKDEENPAYVLSRSCLDDKDLDDSEACENGNDPFCKVCEAASCNEVALPNVPRLKCHMCNGDDCSSPQSYECTSYREDDQCYALFEKDTNKVLRMGCGSDWDNSQLIAQKRSLFLCSGDNCNDKEKFPKSTGCAACRSNVFLDCATNPQATIVTMTCDVLPFTQCYSRVDEDGITHRGCLSDVSDDKFDECLSSDSGKCLICDQNNCNTEVFPTNRRSCHRCDSSVNAACEESPHEFASVCPLHRDDESCVTKVEGFRLLRGCASEFICDPNDYETCQICSDSDNCNSVNLLSSYIGEPGRWQDLPLNCYTCDGENCASDIGSPQRCEHNNLQTCMTVFGSDGKVQKRGCSDSVKETYASYCEANSEKCIACKSNTCNDAQSLEEFNDCYFCDSAENKDCSSNFDLRTRTRKCKGSCMVALYPRSFTIVTSYELTRTCLDDLDLEDRNKCEAGEMKYCQACKGSRCNAMSLEITYNECFKCTDEDCEDFESSVCQAYQPNDQCYLLYDYMGSVASMGCRSDLQMDVVTELVKQKRMLLCDGKNCNSPAIVQVRSCLTCDSADDTRCATNPNLIDNSLRCSALPYTNCMTRVNEAGHTVRGCVASLPSEEFYDCITSSSGKCTTCTTDNCNAIDIFPESRLRCHQCDSNSNSECESAPNANRVCPLYDPDDYCITNLQNGVTYRGCASSIKCYDENDRRTCQTCKTAGCNKNDLTKIGEDGEPGIWQDLPLTCYHCTDESDCEKAGVFRVCQNNILQSCMTVFNVAGKVIERGCSDNVKTNNQEYCSSSPDKCLSCNSNGCNTANSLDDFVECLSCDTNRNTDCALTVGSVTRTRKCHKHCMTAMYPREQENNPAYHLTRACLDDMDLDDREACLEGKKEYCKACDGPKCNTDTIPEKRLSCNMCKGENCQEPQQKSCAYYRKDDQCYVLYDELPSIIAMGCRSEYSNAEADFLLKEKRLYVCSEDNCNDIESLPQAQRCHICSSRTDIACATNPQSLTVTTNCGVVPNTECYSRVLYDGSTERGCVSSLYDDEFVSCISGNSPSCRTCRGNSCNNQVFPENRSQCHICNSSDDPLCEWQPSSLGICPQYDAQDTCVTVYQDGITRRGCSSSLSCENESARSCSRCTGIGCNTINLANRQDENRGKWQDLPLRCHVCNGRDDCMKLSTVESCQNNNEQDCVVVFNENGEVVRRGCEDDVEETHRSFCAQFSDHCINCKSNECNIAAALSEFVDCIYCDSHQSLNCFYEPQNALLRTRKCRGSCMTALYPSGMSSSPAYDLIRTCLDDKELSDQEKCLLGRDGQCKSCLTNNCNIDDIPENRLSCLSCSNGNCEEPVAMKCPLYKETDQCFIWFDTSNSVQEMGCTSSFRNQELEAIIKTKRVYVCNDGDNCNSLDKVNGSQKCAACNSKDNDVCVVNAMLVGTFDECTALPYTSCYSMLDTSDGSTMRGCVSELDGDNFADCVLGKSKNCEICNGDGCNREVFPADRQQCHVCSSLEDHNCESTPIFVRPCTVGNEKESCITALSGDETIRGCSSEVFCDANDKKTCRSCFGTSCNSIDLRNKVYDSYHGLWQELPLRCHMCTGEDCLSSLGPALSCSTNNIEQDCMTVFGKDGNVTRRGCSDDVEDYEDLYCRLNPHLCFKCKSNECNMAWSIDEYVECDFCISAENPACVANPASNEFAKRQCYKECMVTLRTNDELIRSCLDDKENSQQTVCRDGNSECISCSDGLCNNFVLPPDRLKCHTCQGSECSASVGEYCFAYKADDFCFAKYGKDSKVELMGCGSSQNSTDIEEWQQQNKLYRCNESDCNDLIKIPTGDTMCAVCDSTDSPECAQNPMKLNAFEKCAAPSNQCITFINNGKTIRACASLLTETEKDSCKEAGTCAVCTGEKCNTEIFPTGRLQCHICSSESNSNCKNSPNSLMVCQNYLPNDRCVAENTNDLIVRGCTSDFICDTNDKQRCQICDSNGCNTADLSVSGNNNNAGSTAITAASALFTSILALISIRGLTLF